MTLTGSKLSGLGPSAGLCWLNTSKMAITMLWRFWISRKSLDWSKLNTLWTRNESFKLLISLSSSICSILSKWVFIFFFFVYFFSPWFNFRLYQVIHSILRYWHNPQGHLAFVVYPDYVILFVGQLQLVHGIRVYQWWRNVFTFEKNRAILGTPFQILCSSNCPGFWVLALTRSDLPWSQTREFAHWQ